MDDPNTVTWKLFNKRRKLTANMVGHNSKRISILIQCGESSMPESATYITVIAMWGMEVPLTLTFKYRTD